MDKAKSMKRPFKEDGIRWTAWDLDKDKALGPDGFPIEFFKDNWDIIKVKLIVFDEFFINGRI